MKPIANFAARLAFGLTGLGVLAFVATVHAQTAAPTIAESSAPTAAASASTPAYQDHYIAGGTLAPDISTGDVETNDTGRLYRSLQIDGVASVLSSNGGGYSNNTEENGLVLRSQWDTAGYGAWSLDASARTGASGQSEGGQGGVVTLRQRAMPFDDGWQADNALGDVNSPDISLARLQPRLYLPTGPMQGATTEWRGPSDLQMVAGGGVPGQFGGILLPDFRTLGGSTATVGAQWSPASHWTLGGQLVEAHDVNLEAGSLFLSTTPLISSTTELLTAAWADHEEHVQMNLVNDSISGMGDALGGWIDASIAQGRISQTAGLFRIDPNMTWGNQLITSDAQGGYYRFGYQSRQWVADAGVDELRSVSGLGSNTTFVTGDTRYQFSRDWGVGSIANLSHSNGSNSWSLQGYVDHANSWGTSRAETAYAESPTAQDVSLAVDQNWSGDGIRLSTGASVNRISGTALGGLVQDGTVVALAAYGGGNFTTRFGAEGNVRWARAVQGEAAPGVFVNVSLTYQIAPQWQILATYYESQVGSYTPLTVESPLTMPLATVVPSVRERGAFLTVRYKHSQGSHFAPLGGGPGAGSGDITGVIYLDANDNGRYDAGEAGAANVTVVLDGRFSAQTDSAGRFSFPVVASGHHVITVISDNLPLPWTLLNDGRTPIEVSTRDRTDIAIPARRPR